MAEYILPWKFEEDTKIVTLTLFESGEKRNEWAKSMGYAGTFWNLQYSLGFLWINFGKFLERYRGNIEIVKIINAENCILPLVAWLVKCVLGQKMKVEFVNPIKTQERVLAGNFDKYLKVDTLLEDINEMSIIQLRELAEIFSTTHIVTADSLYQIDFGSNLGDFLPEEEIVAKRPVIKNKVATWQAYGRYSLRNYRERVFKEFNKTHEECLIVPCTIGKPYYTNSNGKIIVGGVKSAQNSIKEEINKGGKDVCVMTTIGITPQQYWVDPVDLGYDVRVPDLWSDYISMKNFFMKNQYEKVHSFLNYGPYIEMLKMLNSQGIIKEIVWKVTPELSTKKGNFGAFFSIKQGDKQFEQLKYAWELSKEEMQAEIEASEEQEETIIENQKQ